MTMIGWKSGNSATNKKLGTDRIRKKSKAVWSHNFCVENYADKQMVFHITCSKDKLLQQKFQKCDSYTSPFILRCIVHYYLSDEFSQFISLYKMKKSAGLEMIRVGCDSSKHIFLCGVIKKLILHFSSFICCVVAVFCHSAC